MTAVAERDSNDDHFVGQVLKRASPILTWRPAKVQRITLTPKAPDGTRKMGESSIQRISRATTRRMVAWPVVKRVERAREGALRALVVRLAGAAVVVCALMLVAYAALGGASRPARAPAPATRVAIAHVLDERSDLLSARQEAAEAAFLPASAPPPGAAVLSTTPTPAPGRRGRAHHGHRRVAGVRR